MNRICSLFGIQYPIIQAGMVWCSGWRLASAVSNAGGLGLIGAGSMHPEVLREHIRKCEAATDKPFGVNIMLMHPQADEFAKIVVEEGVPVVTTGAGNPGKYIPAWKAAGIKVIPVVAAAVLAKHLEPLGIDFICKKLPDGVEMGGGGGQMRAEDMAKFIQFFLQRGVWDGKHLLNENWFDRATVKQIETVNPVFTNHDSNWRLGYGFQMWRCIPDGLYRADGAFGQFGVVVPDKDAVLVTNSVSLYPDDLLNLMWKYLLPGMADEELPENPAAKAELDRLAEKAQMPALWGIHDRNCEKKMEGVKFAPEIELPGLTALIGGSGTLADRSGKVQELSMHFEETCAMLTVKQQDGLEEQLPIAMDNGWSRTTLRGKTYAATGRWMGADVFEFEARNVNAASGCRFLLTFKDDGLTMQRVSTLPTKSFWDDLNMEAPIAFKRI